MMFSSNKPRCNTSFSKGIKTSGAVIIKPLIGSSGGTYVTVNNKVCRLKR